jgi:hypothetical protein
MDVSLARIAPGALLLHDFFCKMIQSDCLSLSSESWREAVACIVFFCGKAHWGAALHGILLPQGFFNDQSSHQGFFFLTDSSVFCHLVPDPAAAG